MMKNRKRHGAAAASTMNDGQIFLSGTVLKIINHPQEAAWNNIQLIFVIFVNWSEKFKLLTMTRHIFLRNKPLIHASQGRFTMTGRNLEERKNKVNSSSKKCGHLNRSLLHAVRLERRKGGGEYFSKRWKEKV